jgi:predicted RNase H-like HicB family nuclease
MATFIAIVQSDGDYGYTASFPDFPGCIVTGSTLDHVLAKAKEALAAHIEGLLKAKQKICIPTTADAIERGDALLIAGVDVPDDLRMSHMELSIPALSLAWIDSFARRRGLTYGALFVQAVNRWVMQETAPRERRGEISDGPTLFDFGNPLELKVEAVAGELTTPDEANERDGEQEISNRSSNDDVTAELARLFDERSDPRPISRAVEEAEEGRKGEAK